MELLCDALGPSQLLRLSGREGINLLPEFEVRVLSDDPDIDLDKVIAQPASLVFTDDLGSAFRIVQSVVVDVSYAGLHRDGHAYDLRLASFVFPLTLRSGHRIFQKKSTQQIVLELLQEAKIDPKKLVFRMQGKYESHDHVAQYGETEWNFIERLLADEGISYWFDDNLEGERTLVFGDAAKSHAPISEPVVVPFVDQSGGAGATAIPHVFELEVAEEITHDAVHVREYDVRKPDALIEGKAGDGILEWFEFPCSVRTKDAATERAKVRLEQLARDKHHALGRTACSRLQPGRVFTLFGANGGDTPIDGDWLIVTVEHEVVVAAPHNGSPVPYRNEVKLVPWTESGMTFRPAPREEKPIIEGFETAVTTGAGGEEIHVDDLARVKLKFHWDRSDVQDDKSSTWIRTMQMGTGGSMLLPRVGWEVPVAYFHGDPSRPFVVGRVYNPSTPPPYGLPGAKATAALKSSTSPGGGSANEISMADDAGSQLFGVTASKDHTIGAGGDYKREVAVNENHDVVDGFEANILGAFLSHVGANASASTQAGQKMQSKTGMIFNVGAVDYLATGGSRKITVLSGFGEAIGGLHLIQCNQSALQVTGVFKRQVGGTALHASGLKNGESVTGWRKLNVGGAVTIRAVVSASEESKALAEYDTGSGKDAALGEISHKCPGRAQFLASGDIDYAVDERVLIKGPKVLIKGNFVDIEGGKKLEVGRGNIKIDGGKVKIKATIKRTQGSKADS